MTRELLGAAMQVFVVDEEKRTVAWEFDRRKHKPWPHKLHRGRICKRDPESELYEITPFCPFHTAKELLARTAPGGFLFVAKETGRPFEYEKLQKLLKALGRRQGAKNWQRHGTQAWRRGAAADRARRAKHLEEILSEGDWSAKSKTYLR